MDAEFKIILQLFLTVLLCGLIGFEREIKKRGAGLQTYSLVGLGSALFAVLTFHLRGYSAGGSIDPTHLIQAVATGIGFIGAGVVFRGEKHVEGLTTAAGLWVVSAIGIAVAMELYAEAVASTLLTLFVLVVFGFLERRVFNKG
jgi:putative Mg2+ transporter-C (MgtC) family protein